MAVFNKIAVIGAGTMGAQIAAHCANAGAEVLLLDIVPQGAGNRNALAEGALAKLRKTEPAAFMSDEAVRRVSVGNIEDDLWKLAESDWIVEAIIERLDLKQALYAKIDGVMKDGAVVSSNTSTIPLSALTHGLSERFRRGFCITHFFNPPRYMRLLELVTAPETDAARADDLARFIDVRLGKSVVRAKDSPGFIANRLGVYWLQGAVVEAVKAGLDVEVADALIGRPFGIPKTGVFGLVDLVGLDLMPHINASLAATLPEGDAFHALNVKLPVIETMIAEGYTGRKGKGGFYRRGPNKAREAIDLVSGAYRAVRKPNVAEAKARDLKSIFDGTTPEARYAATVMGRTLAYAASLIPSAAERITDIDEAMKLGYNWALGPFELIDKLGAGWFADWLTREGLAVPPVLDAARGKRFYEVKDGRLFALQDGTLTPVTRPEGVLLLADIKRATRPILKNPSAALWDIGDGVECFEFTSKSNSLDLAIMELLGQAIARKPRGLVIHNEGRNFSVGANLGLAILAANVAAWSEIEKLIKTGQETYKALKYAPFPVVAAPSGMALGGGCEILLHSDAIQAHAELYAGLVEAGVGLIPGWGGCKEMLARYLASPRLPKGPMPAPVKVFEMISTAYVSKSAAQAQKALILRDGDEVTMNRDRLLHDAKQKALKLAEHYTPPAPPIFRLPGDAGATAFEMAVRDFHAKGMATDYDVVVAGELGGILSGGTADPTGEVDEDFVLGLERAAFMRLVKREGTLARIEHMLTTGKPLRN
ncbi:3-hydroxyacyl-CoA dehydrogenase/enoyl-CoA hydratase family protein [Acidocella sp.]|uniref:3-hydroxyacyl-CoA dehydrogenase/enoyl-CoA hydratase family protein n=1 Tax=Acidocella sp. TaxID=50710 RepID=UPI0026088F1E|nr:3-hydroxyacyl-CoA dehydrogenase/enoyl-CoA hydratase family protein [Acidocella sp.]